VCGGATGAADGLAQRSDLDGLGDEGERVQVVPSASSGQAVALGFGHREEHRLGGAEGVDRGLGLL